MVNRNKHKYIHSLLKEQGSSNLTFEFKKNCTLLNSNGTLNIPFEAISKIKKGKSIIFDCTEWSSAPRYQVTFNYYKNNNYSVISRGSNGITHVFNDPVYTMEINDLETGNSSRYDIYYSVKDCMTGKVLTAKKRMCFEKELVKIIDSSSKLNVDKAIAKAVLNSSI